MLSREDSRRLAQLERQLRRDDPEFCERMSGGGRPVARRAPMWLVLVAVALWITALVLGVSGLWIAAGVVAVCATTIGVTLAYRTRPQRRPRHADPEPLPPGW